MMDEFEGYRQVICLASPSPEHIAPRASVELSTIANDELAELVAKYPDRFAGAAGAVPMNEPDAACREIERLFDQLRLCAVQIFTNVNGRPLDSPEFRPVWKTLADLGVPVLLHPARSSNHADYAAEQDSKYLIWQVFGWPYEARRRRRGWSSAASCRRIPGLKILVHHTAAMIPFLHGRMKSMFDMFAEDFAIQTEGRLTKHPHRILPPVLRRHGRVLAGRRERRPRFSRRRPPAVRHRCAVRRHRRPVLDS